MFSINGTSFLGPCCWFSLRRTCNFFFFLFSFFSFSFSFLFLFLLLFNFLYNVLKIHKLYRNQILVGDPKQLSPTISTESENENGLDRTLFDRMKLLGNEPAPLYIQYRVFIYLIYWLFFLNLFYFYFFLFIFKSLLSIFHKKNKNLIVPSPN